MIHLNMEDENALIGASLAQVLGESRSSVAASCDCDGRSAANSTAAGPQHHTLDNSTRYPATVFPYILNPSGETSSGKRILLQGSPGSGRTSIAMDLAYSLASKGSACCLSDLNCRCTKVVVYRKLKLKDSSPSSLERNDSGTDAQVENYTFPTRCYRQDPRSATSATCDKRSPSGNMSMSESPSQAWNPLVLSHIKIQSVDSTREILQDLLSVMGRPNAQQPKQAIIIDDLDAISDVTNPTQNSFPGRSDQNQNSTTSMMQMLAVAVDTSHALQRLHGTLPVVLGVCSSNRNIVAPWMDTLVTLRPTSFSQSSTLEQHEKLKSSWMAEFHNSGEVERYALVEYGFWEHRASGYTRILWKPT